MAIDGILATATSALTANARRVSAVANNLANLDTEGFRPRDVRTVSRATGRSQASVDVGGGVDTTVVEEDGPVEPVKEFSKLIQARAAYGMALQMLRVGDQISSETINFHA